MEYKVSYYPYQREFKTPLKTSHGIWKYREGIIIKLGDNFGNISLGEIAPIPWFGSENMDDAMYFCQQLNGVITDSLLRNIPDNLPCCQFAFSAALLSLTPTLSPRKLETNSVNYCYLLPTGEDVLKVNFQELNYHTFKWKIGVNWVYEEFILLEKLVNLLPENAKLRLDANTGLNSQTAKQWLTFTDSLNTPNIIEFIEQPLKPIYFSEMLALSQEYNTMLALDESVANLKQLKSCYESGWKGVFVLKVGIMGSIVKLCEFLSKNNLDVVFSSVLETQIGAKIALNIAQKYSQRAVGFGVNHWFKDNIIINGQKITMDNFSNTLNSFY